MCGIAGYSFDQPIKDVGLLGQLLLAGISERGSDATGFAFLERDKIVIRKWSGPLHRHLDKIDIPDDSVEAIFHVREYTKGNPGLMANNHPIRHGKIVGVHNGVIVNDEQLFHDLAEPREEQGMTVDSEAIFMLVDRKIRPWKSLIGTYSAAWLDEHNCDEVHLMRGRGRPLHLAQTKHGYVWASTEYALRYSLHKSGVDIIAIAEVAEGTYYRFGGGKILEKETFQPYTDADYIIPEYPLDDPESIIARRAMESILRGKL